MSGSAPGRTNVMSAPRYPNRGESYLNAVCTRWDCCNAWCWKRASHSPSFGISVLPRCTTSAAAAAGDGTAPPPRMLTLRPGVPAPRLLMLPSPAVAAPRMSDPAELDFVAGRCSSARLEPPRRMDVMLRDCRMADDDGWCADVPSSAADVAPPRKEGLSDSWRAD